MNRLFKRVIFSILFVCTPLVLSGCLFGFSRTRAYTFELSTLDGSQIEKKREDGRMPSEVVAEELNQRLTKYGLSDVKTQCPRYDEVYIQYKDKDSSIATNIKNLLMFGGRLALFTKLNDILDNSKTDEKFILEDAYVDMKSGYPLLVIPFSGPFELLYNVAKGYKDDDRTEAAELEDTGDGEESAYTYYLYLCSDYHDGDTYETGVEEGKILAKFDISQFEKTSPFSYVISTYINIVDENGDGAYSKKEQKAAEGKAKLYAGYINSNPLDYNLTHIKTEYAIGI